MKEAAVRLDLNNPEFQDNLFAWRDGAWLRMLSLHPDHDSAYR